MTSMRPDWHNWLIVVPARLAATRLPRKPLADLCGKPLILRVVENLAALRRAGATVRVATDSEEILGVCQMAHHEAVLTHPDHASGTDRCQEAAATSEEPYILNVQCDEPFLSLSDLQNLAVAMESDPEADIATLAYESTDMRRFSLPQAVKVVTDAQNRALYFSRAPIPTKRDKQNSEEQVWLQHVGIYAFRRASLGQFCALPQGRLEQSEKLEQLRALENGMRIRVVQAMHLPLGIDTEQDLEEARARFKS